MAITALQRRALSLLLLPSCSISAPLVAQAFIPSPFSIHNKRSVMCINSTNGSDNDTASKDDDFQSFTPEELGAGSTYGLCISSVVPRPVAVISSVSEDENIVNVAPFSYSSLLSHDPPIVSHGLCLKGTGQKKDSLLNIESNNNWVFNVLSKNYLERANQCAASLPPEQDEAELNGLETIPSDLVKAPRLKDALVSMECTLYDKKEVYNDSGKHTTTIVFGRVVKFHLHSSVIKEGSTMEKPLVDLEKLQAVGRAGDITYWPVGTSSDTVLPMARPK